MNTPTLGLDIALRSFAAAVWFTSTRILRAEFENTPVGFRRLSRWLKTHGLGPLRVGVEATNTYADAVVEFLHEAGHTVFVLNPERTAYYARSVGQRNKTDPADAVTIARYVANHDDCTPWRPAPSEQKTLRELTRTRHQLTKYATQLSNQLRTATGAGRSALETVLQTVKAQIDALVKAVKAHLKAHPTLRTAVYRIMTIKGMGLVSAATVLAELPPITRESDPRTICGWAGLTPVRRQSGKTEWRSSMSRKGNEYLRQAFYMPALVAKRWNPLFKEYARRLAENGKTTGSILGAISHKMLRTIVGLLRSGTDFDPNWCAKNT